jgi:hypothetical protein
MTTYWNDGRTEGQPEELIIRCSNCQEPVNHMFYQYNDGSTCHVLCRKCSQPKFVAEHGTDFNQDFTTEKPTLESCQSCRFFDRLAQGHSLCRRYPPQLIAEYESLWPETNKNSWCGEYRPAAKLTKTPLDGYMPCKE